MATEITEGGDATLEARDRMRQQELPLLDRFTEGFVDHDPAGGQPAGGEGLAWFWERFGEAFSDVDRSDDETIVTPTKVITISTLAGTHTGEWLGHAPTGRRFTGIRNVQVIGFSDGRASERWGSTDELGILQQLGLA